MGSGLVFSLLFYPFISRLKTRPDPVFLRDLGGETALGDSIEFLTRETEFFGLPLGSPVIGEVVNNVPILYRSAFAINFDAIRIGNAFWQQVNFTQYNAARFSAIHELGHVVNPSYSEVQVNRWAYERY